ncbi:MAG: hypothetical protein DIU78_014010 [Pseudomonadota bacterium]|nr:MAG: hypothetical protein DIU78_22640 [Pseudomonadota bacterium]
MKNERRLGTLIGVVGAVLALSGCDDPLVPVELIEKARVLGARLEVEGAPERAAPAPGESARVRFLVVAPELDLETGYALQACFAEWSPSDLPACKGEPFARAERSTPDARAPVLDLVLPEYPADARVPRLLVRGVICADGAPSDEGGERCAPNAAPLRVSFDLELPGPDDAPNLNPSLPDDALTLDGEAWPPASARETACRELDVPEVPVGSAHVIRVALPERAREAVPPPIEGAPEFESLLVSHFATHGELERAFSPLPGTGTSLDVTVTWTAPATAPDDGELARFWFVVRDGRGGADFVERAVCVVPN